MNARAVTGTAAIVAVVICAAPVFAAGWDASGQGLAAVQAATVSAPSAVSASCPNNSTTTTVTWTPVSVTTASWFLIEVSTNGGSTWTANQTVQKTAAPFTASVTTNARNTTYSFRVTAKTNETGGWSSSATNSSNTTATGTNSKC